MKGRVINISSVAALFSAPGTAIYSMSKAAVSSLTDGLRRELYNKGVEVIEIQPQAYKWVTFASNKRQLNYKYLYKKECND